MAELTLIPPRLSERLFNSISPLMVSISLSVDPSYSLVTLPEVKLNIPPSPIKVIEALLIWLLAYTPV